MKKILLPALCALFSLGCVHVHAQSITTNPISGSPFCGGATITVSYTATGTFHSGNAFTAQLSNHKGSFASPVAIGSVTSTTSGNITATIPLGTKSGTKYRIRVVSSSPAVTGTDNGSNLKINPKPSGTTATNITACAATLTWNAQSNASSYKVRYKKTSESSYSSVIDVGNVTSYTFTNLHANTSYELNVRSVCSNGELSDWAKEKNVVTGAVAVPTGAVVYPGIAIATLDWNDMPCAASYRTRYRIIGDPVWSYKTSTASTVVLTGLWPATDYEAQISTITATNDSSAYGALLQWNMDYRWASGQHSSAHIELHPNPVSEVLTVIVEGSSEQQPLRYEVTNFLGQKINSAYFLAPQGKQALTISVAHLPAGMYWLRVVGHHTFAEHHFVKQ